jgi:glycosyltransferase involved in cell wall biosynthesis
MNKHLNVHMVVSNPFKPDPRVLREAKILTKMGFYVNILAWDRECKWPKKEKYEKITIERIRLLSPYDKVIVAFLLPIFWFYSILKLMKKKIDIIHCHDYDTMPIGLIIKYVKRVPLIYDSHEFYPGMVKEKLTPLF